LEFLQVVRTV